MTVPRRRFSEILLLEDNATLAERRQLAGVGSDNAGRTITIRVHRCAASTRVVAATKTYDAGSMRSGRSARIELAVQLIKRSVHRRRRAVVVAGAAYGSAQAFRDLLFDSGLPFVVQIRPGTLVSVIGRTPAVIRAVDALSWGHWRKLKAVLPDGSELECSAAKLANVALPLGRAKLFAAQVGSILGAHRGTIIGLASLDAALPELVRLIAHARWIRRDVRVSTRGTGSIVGAEPSGTASTLTARANIALARQQDARAGTTSPARNFDSGGPLHRAAGILNVVDLFSGAGGMGLGFLLGGGTKARYRIVYSGEANPIFAETLRRNHRAYERVVGLRPGARTPSLLEAVDLREKEALLEASATAKSMGGAHFLIGGPPCQGFSMANRNSWSGRNPHNELIDVFLKYIQTLRPLGFLMENVQGIIWTPNGRTSVSVVDVIERRMRAAGYVLFPKLIDAVWYGVPQHRTRFFLMGLHKDLGYHSDSFGDWGPFPAPTHGVGRRPLVTVRNAIGDLPRVGNGHASDESDYQSPSSAVLRGNEFLRYARAGAQQGLIEDHVTSRHADYVIDRYRKIPAGGNWESIRSDLTNYADVSRTHSNIYRRLRWNEPSVTIGHYRKSMLVHPSQHRGLSLREAARLQSFPDWFRFAGLADGGEGGLVHKQQQLANAVCPLVTKAVAEFILSL